jgi:hypothetical protein
MERSGRAYLDGFATARLVLQHDGLTVGEILDSLDPLPESDWKIHPWRRGYKAAIRSAFGR